HPSLRIVLVETEVSWLPFVVDQWDFNLRNKLDLDDPALEKQTWPSEYVRRNVAATFVRDTLVGKLAPDGWLDSWMWSSDYPHPASTWPNSRKLVSEQLSSLSSPQVHKLIWDNAARLYSVPDAVAEASLAG